MAAALFARAISVINVFEFLLSKSVFVSTTMTAKRLREGFFSVQSGKLPREMKFLLDVGNFCGWINQKEKSNVLRRYEDLLDSLGMRVCFAQTKETFFVECKKKNIDILPEYMFKAYVKIVGGSSKDFPAYWLTC